jgi:hypothetical protein
MADTLVLIAKALSSILVVWGGVQLALGLHDSSGHQVQTGIWQMVGGGVLYAAAVIIGNHFSLASTTVISGTSSWHNICGHPWDTSHNVLKKQTELLAVHAGNLIDNVGSAFGSFLTNTDVEKAVVGAAGAIADSVGVPLLSIFSLLEIISAARKFEGQGTTGLAIPFSFVARIMFAYEFVADKLYLVVFNILQYLGTIFFNAMPSISGISGSQECPQCPQECAMFNIVHNGWNDIGANVLATLGVYFQYFFLYIVVLMAFVAVGIAIITRMARLYLFLLAAPVAVSSFASSEFDHMGKGWLRGTLSVSLEAGFIYAGLYIGTIIMGLILSPNSVFGGIGPLTGALIRPALAMGSLVAIVFGAGGVAKQALGG